MHLNFFAPRFEYDLKISARTLLSSSRKIPARTPLSSSRKIPAHRSPFSHTLLRTLAAFPVQKEKALHYLQVDSFSQCSHYIMDDNAVDSSIAQLIFPTDMSVSQQDRNTEGEQASHVGVVVMDDMATVASGGIISSPVNLIGAEDVSDSFKPVTPLEMKPTIGMEFNSLDDLFKFYNEYAWFSGFSVRKDKTRVLKSGVISMRILRCFKAGIREEKWKELHNRKLSARRVTRCDCPAKIVANLKSGSGTYHVTQFVEAHNHVLATPRKRHWLRSHRKVTEEQLSMISSLKSSGVGVSQSLDFMSTEAGGQGCE